MSKLDLDEKIFLKKITAISNKDKDTVRDVFLALLEMATIELYGFSDTIVIPHICRLKVKAVPIQTYKGIDYQITLEATPSRDFIAEYKAIHTNQPTPTEKYIKKQIEQKFKNLLKIDDFNLLKRSL